MATLAIMIGGAILNATAFIGGSYLAKSSSGKNQDAERKRHDLALEKYHKDWAEYQKKKQHLENWEYHRKQIAVQASENFNNVDEALQYYNETHHQNGEHIDDEPDFSNYYKPNDEQKKRRDYLCRRRNVSTRLFGE